MNSRMNGLLVLVLSMGTSAAFGQETVAPLLAPPSATQPTDNATSRINREKVRMLLDKAREEGIKGNDEEQKKYLTQLAEMARQAWDLQDAELCGVIFRQILSVKVDFAEAQLGLAELYRRTNPIMAVEWYTRYLAMNPGDPGARYGRGSCYLSRNMYTLAIEDLRYLVDRLEPNHVGGLANLALAIRGRAGEKGKDNSPDPDLMKEALDYMAKAVHAATESKDPEIRKMVPELKYKLAQLTYDYDRILVKARAPQAGFDQTITRVQDAIQTALAAADADIEGTQALSQVLDALGVLGQVYSVQIDDNPNDPVPYLQLADLVNRRSVIEQRAARLLALAFYRKAVEADSRVADNWVLLFQNYLQGQQDVLRCYAAFGIRGDAPLQMLKQAQAALEKATALEATKKMAEYWAVLFQIYRQLQMAAPAQAAIDRAIALDPENQDYRRSRAQFVQTTRPAGPASRPAP